MLRYGYTYKVCLQINNVTSVITPTVSICVWKNGIIINKVQPAK